MNWLHTLYFHIWHFQYQQEQLTNWFGNIEADVVGLLISAVIWKFFLKNLVQNFFSKAHKKALDIHYERTQKAEEKRHKEIIDQSERHQQERLSQQENHHKELKEHISNTLNSEGNQTSK